MDHSKTNAFDHVLFQLRNSGRVNPDEYYGMGLDLIPSAYRGYAHSGCVAFKLPNDPSWAFGLEVMWRWMHDKTNLWLTGIPHSEFFVPEERMLVVDADSEEFNRVVNIIGDWMEQTDMEFVWVHSPHSLKGKNWLSFSMGDSFEEQALTADLRSLFPDSFLCVDEYTERVIQVKWLTDDKDYDDRCAEFVDVMDRFLTDGIYNVDTYIEVVDKFWYDLEAGLAMSIINAAATPEKDIARYCMQFHGQSAIPFIVSQMALEGECLVVKEPMANGLYPDGDHINISLLDASDPENQLAGFITEWADWLDQQVENQMSGKANAAVDQPQLPLQMGGEE